MKATKPQGPQGAVFCGNKLRLRLWFSLIDADLKY